MAIKKTTEASEETNDEMTAEVEDTQAEREPDDKIRKRDIYDHVTVATGLRKREVREAVDATLEYFHKCLTEKKDLQIPPLGKIRSIERGEGDKAKMIYKVHLQTPKKDDDESEEALAASGNDD